MIVVAFEWNETLFDKHLIVNTMVSKNKSVSTINYGNCKLQFVIGKYFKTHILEYQGNICLKVDRK